MIFTSIEFLVFYSVLLILLLVFNRNTYSKLIILCASLYFYSFWDYRFVVLILLQTLLEFFLGKVSYSSDSKKKRKTVLCISIITNLGVLIYFKYLNWFLESLLKLFPSGINDIHFFKIALPLGLSFYTFRLLSYSIDIYRKKIKPAYSLIDFSIYVFFFPIIISGPISRAVDILPQIQTLKITPGNFLAGARLFIIGAFLKVFVADQVAMFVNFYYDNYSAFNTFTSWLAIAAYSLQIYADFAGYSSMAIGAALIIGIRLDDNFDYPYLSINIKEFWKKWHISLSTWIKDYIYIPLGGNKNGRLRTYINLVFTMSLCGLWHGAGLNYIFWGFLHGIYLIAYDNYSKNINYRPMKPWLGILFTNIFVCFAWIFFRSESFDKSLKIVKHLFVIQNGVSWHPPFIIFILGSALLLNFLKKKEVIFVELPLKAKYTLFIIFCLIWLTVVFYPTEFQPFVYAQF